MAVHSASPHAAPDALVVEPVIEPDPATISEAVTLPTALAYVAIAAETTFVAGASATALPMAIAVFPQEMQIPTSALEPEFREAKDASGRRVKHVLCNKGL